MLLAEPVNAVGLCFTGVGLSVSRLPFDPVELLEEPESLFRRAATILSRLEGFDEAPPGMRNTLSFICINGCREGGVSQRGTCAGVSIMIVVLPDVVDDFTVVGQRARGVK